MGIKRREFLRTISVAVYFLFFLQTASADVISTRKWEAVEIALTSGTAYSNAYTQVTVEGVFSGPGGQNKTVRAFWDGKDGNQKDIFKIRFTPTAEGAWNYSITSTTHPSDTGLRQTGTINAGAAAPETKGFVRADSQYPTKLAYDNGDYYFMMGTTAYEYMVNANNNMARWKDTVDFYKSKGINKVRFYVFPTDYRYYCKDAGVGMKYPNDDTRPFLDSNTNYNAIKKPDFDRLNLAHWQLLDEMVEYMASRGMVADLLMLNDPCYGRAYDTKYPNAPTAKDQRYMKYIVSRYAAYPNVTWCVVNEFQLPTTGSSIEKPEYGTSHPGGVAWNNYWNAMGSLVKASDPWAEDMGKKRLLSIHGWQKKAYPDRTKRFSSNIDTYDFVFSDQGWPAYAIGEWGVWPSGFSSGSTKISYMPEWEGQRSVVEVLKRKSIPATNDEFLYVGGSAMDGSFFNSNANRRNMWGLAIAGAYLSIGDGYSESGGTSWGYRYFSTGNYSNTGEMQKVFEQTGHLINFFQRIPHWKMISHNELVAQYSKTPWNDANRVYTLADPGNEYVVYAATGSAFSIQLDGTKDYAVYKFDPRTGVETQIATVFRPTAPYSIAASSGNDWVYHIKAANGGTPADVNSDGSVDILDLQLCVNVILGTETAPAIMSMADVNKDSSADILDVQEIVNAILAG